jgi:hypothetical protein
MGDYPFEAGSSTIYARDTSVPNSNFLYSKKVTANSTTLDCEYSCFHRMETEVARPLFGKTVTFSFWIYLAKNGGKLKTQCSNGGGTNTKYHQVPINTWVQLTHTVTLGTTPYSDPIGIFCNLNWQGPVTSGQTVYYTTGWMLTEGSVVPPTYVRAGGDYAGELALCQRYYWKLQGTLTGMALAAGFAADSVTTLMNVEFPVTMRIPPTTVLSSGTASDLRVSDNTTNTALSANPAMGSYTNKRCVINCTVASGLTAFRPYHLQMNSTSGYLAFDVEV